MRPTTNAMQTRILIVILAIGGLVFAGVVFYTVYNNLTIGSTDYYPSWKAAELFFKEGVSPYDDRVGIESQQKIYGRPAKPDEDQFWYVYPFYGIFYVGPLAFVDYQLAAAIYICVLLAGLLLALALFLHGIPWLPSPPMLAMLVLWTVVAYFSVRGLLLAQHAFLAYTAHIIALWGILRGRDRVSGAALAASTIKPQTGYLIVPLLLVWAWRTRRYGVLWGFAGVFGLLCGVSFILQPSWFGDWIGQVRAYEGYTETYATAQIVTHIIDGVPAALENTAQLLLTALLAIPVVLFWRRSLVDNVQDEFLWGYCLTMTFSLTVAPRTATTYYVELYPVLSMTALVLSRQKRAWLAYGAGVALLIAYWALHILTVPEPVDGNSGREAAVVYVVFPVIIWGLLFAYRQDWLTLDKLYIQQKEPSI